MIVPLTLVVYLHIRFNWVDFLVGLKVFRTLHQSIDAFRGSASLKFAYFHLVYYSNSLNSICQLRLIIVRIPFILLVGLPT